MNIRPLAAVVLSVGCSSTSFAPDAGAVHAGTDRDHHASPCAERLDLILYTQAGQLTRVFAKVRKEGADVALLVDTGSQLTFLSAPHLPDGTPNVGAIDFGCGPRSLPGRPFSVREEDPLAGRPIVGYLGADFFAEQPTRLDFSTATITRIDIGTVAANALRLPYTDVFGFLFVDVMFDGNPVKLGFDTGAPHSLWIGVDGQPGDRPQPTQDGYGNPITVYQGTTTLSSATIPATSVPVLRILEHRSIQDGNAAMGVTAHGLFGLTSIPGTAFVIDSARREIWCE